MPGLFKAEFQGTRMIALTSKFYYAEDTKSTSFAKPKISCKGVRKKQISMSWPQYPEVLNGSIDTAMNMGFWLCEQGIVTYTQNKLRFSAYYDKQIVDPDGIHTKPLK